MGGGDRANGVAYASHHGLGAFVAGLLGLKPPAASRRLEHPLLPAALVELEPEDVAINPPRPREIGHGDDGG